MSWAGDARGREDRGRDIAMPVDEAEQLVLAAATGTLDASGIAHRLGVHMLQR